MQATCRRHAPRRIKYQPVEIKIVLTKLSDALIAGKSCIDMFNENAGFTVAAVYDRRTFYAEDSALIERRYSLKSQTYFVAVRGCPLFSNRRKSPLARKIDNRLSRAGS